jgi:hypothetical protein
MLFNKRKSIAVPLVRQFASKSIAIHRLIHRDQTIVHYVVSEIYKKNLGKTFGFHYQKKQFVSEEGDRKLLRNVTSHKAVVFILQSSGL